MSAPDTGLLQSGQSIVCSPALRSLAVTLFIRNVCPFEQGSGLHDDLLVSDFAFCPLSLSRLSPGMQLGTHLCH